MIKSFRKKDTGLRSIVCNCGFIEYDVWDEVKNEKESNSWNNTNRLVLGAVPISPSANEVFTKDSTVIHNSGDVRRRIFNGDHKGCPFRDNRRCS